MSKSKWEEICTAWQKLFNDNGDLIYEGCTLNDKPCGKGTVFYEDGSIYQEGIFGIKGLLSGREYYKNGVLRFEGDYFLNNSYGPNFPKYGKYYNSDGNLVYNGKFQWKRGCVGYPVKCNTDYGPVMQADAPSFPRLTWDDVNPPREINRINYNEISWEEYVEAVRKVVLYGVEHEDRRKDFIAGVDDYYKDMSEEAKNDPKFRNISADSWNISMLY